MDTSEFIRLHRTSDPRQLALQASRYPDVDMPYALDQIQGWQTARSKLPMWACADGIVFPPRLSMEQCSSEATARYKAALAERWTRIVSEQSDMHNSDASVATSMTDLTGGFGVDFSFMSRSFSRATYVERGEALCEVVRSNLPRLGIDNAKTVCANAEEWLAQTEPQTMFFLDPARRNAAGGKTVFIADCSPNVVDLLPMLMEKSLFTIVKLSPMLDWHKAIADLQATVREVHIVSVGGECKELLLVMSSHVEKATSIVCADLDASGAERALFSYTLGEEEEPRRVPTASLSAPLTHLFEPNASVMKAGCFALLASRYGVMPVSHNSHLFLAGECVKSFPGRAFSVASTTTMNKRELRQALAGIDRANIAVRNFPLTAAELRKRLKLKDGGDTYIFATTTADDSHILFICHKC